MGMVNVKARNGQWEMGMGNVQVGNGELEIGIRDSKFERWQSEILNLEFGKRGSWIRN